MTEEKPLMSNQILWEDETCVAKVKSRSGFLISVALTVIVVLGVTIAIVVGWLQKSSNHPLLLAQAVTADECTNIGNHLNALEATAVNGSRAVMIDYKYSAQFIMDTLVSAGVGCQIQTQTFPTAIYTQLSLPQLRMTHPWIANFQQGVDYSGLRYGGNGSFSIQNATICYIPNGGCAPENFTSVTIGCVALIELLSSNDCPTINKSMNAQNAKVSAVILYNNEYRTSLLTSRVRDSGWFPGYPLVQIPVLAASYSIGNLLRSGDVHVTVITDTIIEVVETFNVFCVTEGNPRNEIVVGAHLDSVPEGPGLNDNGSGSCTLLEIVLQWYALGLKPLNKIRFAWWGSEEVGLIGSRYFVRDLQLNNSTQFNNIAMNLNFDMLASPNYNLGIHDGSTAVAAQNGSMVITTFFEEYFNQTGSSYQLISLTGGSDFVPFVESGIPSGGVATGASSIKGEAGRTTFGGLANAACDPCYHLYCDTTDNINYSALTVTAGAAAYVVQKVAEMPNLRDVLNTPMISTPRQLSYPIYETNE